MGKKKKFWADCVYPGGIAGWPAALLDCSARELSSRATDKMFQFKTTNKQEGKKRQQPLYCTV
jgi:hypothetical protein